MYIHIAHFWPVLNNFYKHLPTNHKTNFFSCPWYERICFSPHNACWGCVPPVCVLDGSTKTNSSSALLKKTNTQTHSSLQRLRRLFLHYFGFSCGLSKHCVQCVCPTWLRLFPQSWDFGHIRQRLLPRSRFEQNSVSDPNQLPVPLDSLKTFPQHQSLLSLGTKAAGNTDSPGSHKLISCDRLWSKMLQDVICIEWLLCLESNVDGQVFGGNAETVNNPWCEIMHVW